MFSSVGTSITSWAPRLRSNGKVVSSDSPHHISRARDNGQAGGSAQLERVLACFFYNLSALYGLFFVRMRKHAPWRTRRKEPRKTSIYHC